MTKLLLKRTVSFKHLQKIFKNLAFVLKISKIFLDFFIRFLKQTNYSFQKKLWWEFNTLKGITQYFVLKKYLRKGPGMNNSLTYQL